MSHVILTVIAYLAFNIAVWMSIGAGGIIAIAGANILAALITGIYYREQVRPSPKPKWLIATLGSFGILLIVMGLRGGHAELDVSISMEMVYNGFAVSSWPLFLLLNRYWSKHFLEKPNRFDLYCHGMMAVLVYMRIMTCEQRELIGVAAPSILTAIAGYAMFNISIKLSGGHRITNVAMNLGGGILLIAYALFIDDLGHWNWDLIYIGGFLLGGLAIFMLVKELGESYAFFGKRKQSSIVAPLVYDGILVGSPLVILITSDIPSEWEFIIPIAFGMLLMTIIRYRHHTDMATD